MSALGQKQTSDCRPLMSALPPKADITGRDEDVRFSNRPVEVKRFQATHDGGVDVAHGLVLLYGIGA
jgi:hypothetical protein